MSINILIVDDQAMVRAGFRMILDSESDFDVIGEASDGREAIDEASKHAPDVVLMDIRMPGVDGIEATEHIVDASHGSSKVLILTTFELDEYIYSALRAGASGFMLKDAPADELINAIRVVASGDALLAPRITRRLISEFAARPQRDGELAQRLADLTQREVEVLRLVARGMANKEIAEELYVSETTVKTHVSHVLAKLAIRDRVQAVVVAYECGLAQPGDAGI